MSMEKRLRGRPRLDPTDRSVSVCFKMPARQFDALCRDALRQAVSVPELIRRGLGNKELQNTRRK